MDIKLRSAIYKAGQAVAGIYYLHWPPTIDDEELKNNVVKAEHLDAVDCDWHAYIVALIYCSGYAALVARGLTVTEAEVAALNDFQVARKLIRKWKVPFTLEEVKAFAVGRMSQPDYIGAAESIADYVLENGSVTTSALQLLVPGYYLADDDCADELGEFQKRGGIGVIYPVYEIISKAQKKWKEDNLSAALKIYLKAVRLIKHPLRMRNSIWTVEDSDIIEGLGHLYRDLGEYQKSIEAYKEAWGDSNHILIGHIYYEHLKRYDKARKIYLDLVMSSSDQYYSLAAYNLAQMAYKGYGIEKSLITSLVYTNVALDMLPNETRYTKFKAKLKSEMSLEELNSAKRMTVEILRSRDEAIDQRTKKGPWANVRMD